MKDIAVPNYIKYLLLGVALLGALILTIFPDTFGFLQMSLDGNTVTPSLNPSPSQVVYDTPAPVLVQYSTLDAEAKQATEAAIETYVVEYQFSTEEIMTITADAVNGIYWNFSAINESDQLATLLPKITPEAAGEHAYMCMDYFNRSIDSVFQVESTYDNWDYWKTDEGVILQESLDKVNKFLYWGYRRYNLYTARNAEYPISVIPSLVNYEGNYLVDDPLIGAGIASEDYPKEYPYAEEIEELSSLSFDSIDLDSTPESFLEGMESFSDVFGKMDKESMKAMELEDAFSKNEYESFQQMYSIIIEFVNQIAVEGSGT
ncbi:MAG: hypothetical protein JEZ00_21295 [Anaerolineaceae bacterium]|nr:hypothetical protein [Anaerolineaceae bacterium]